MKVRRKMHDATSDVFVAVKRSSLGIFGVSDGNGVRAERVVGPLVTSTLGHEK